MTNLTILEALTTKLKWKANYINATRSNASNYHIEIRNKQ